MKRLSRTIMTAMLVALLAFTLVGCQSTAKVESIPPAPVVEPAPEPRRSCSSNSCSRRKGCRAC
ncbi:hypothetical protein [uncultured Sphaerochaeta sp.]|uniref:hypothetical protein n=1 Tax=uncultured Sphaerochaeta sp. TaxID=886478 RepID=UPI002A0A2674|nr:hypothetical protein [uncultured Sphaerochaeta sp.]